MIELAICYIFPPYSQLFGEADEDEEVSPDTADPELAGSAATEAMNAQQDDAGGLIQGLVTLCMTSVGF